MPTVIPSGAAGAGARVTAEAGALVAVLLLAVVLLAGAAGTSFVDVSPV